MTIERKAEFSSLLVPEREALHRFALRLCHDRASAEDCLQDAVLVAWRRFDSFTLGTSFRAWMFRILSNVILNANGRLRRSLLRPMQPELLDLVATLEHEQAWSRVLEHPDRVLASVSDDVRGAVKALPPAERMVMLLRAVEGFSYREISECLQIPMGTVMSHLFRARARLRERLTEYAAHSGFARGAT